MAIYIYGLYDPDTKELRYIGKTKNLSRRLWYHIRDAKGGQKTYKATWIRKLLKENKRPLIDVIMETSESNWQSDEKKCISEAVASGVNLTNLTKGGDGIIGYNHSEETKRKISKFNKSVGRVPPNWKGKKQSSEHIRKRVEARKRNGNYKHSEETKRKISRNRKGKNMGNTHTLGLKTSDETKEKISKSLKEFYKDNTEAREKISKRLKGNTHAANKKS